MEFFFSEELLSSILSFKGTHPEEQTIVLNECGKMDAIFHKT